MDLQVDSPPARPSQSTEPEVVAFLSGRSIPCPRCAYDLRNIQTAKCPECGEPLVLKVGSPRLRFGWLVLAMAPGCFSGVAALFVMIPIAVNFGRLIRTGQGLPWPIPAADAFGFLSAASVGLMYRYRHRFVSWRARRQGIFAVSVWGVHALMFGLVLLALWFSR